MSDRASATVSVTQRKVDVPCRACRKNHATSVHKLPADANHRRALLLTSRRVVVDARNYRKPETTIAPAVITATQSLGEDHSLEDHSRGYAVVMTGVLWGKTVSLLTMG